ncbi:MAG: 50S ribosomal protein L9 [Saprospiraceae bacterium]|nr:MAG: 50S ribosomal protein L9 [Saprospiraceae bacterium]
MELILLEDIEKVGDKHTIVTVKDGYGRNYLIPQKMAIVANATNRARLDALRAKEEAEVQKLIGAFQAIADQLEEQTLKIGAKAGTSGKIFGSVTNVQIAAALKEQFNIDIDRRKIILPDEIKELGTYKAVLNLHKEVQPEVRFEVIAE